MKHISSMSFTAERPWGSLPIARMDGITVKLHWTDQPYHWHVNEGEEVFAVMDGEVVMHYRVNGREEEALLKTGDIFYAETGTEHVAHPKGQARILVIEKEGSV
jgi:mannose-6-phosphate isomerase-like protein (cupin superfamily)